jgi:hypothetical protein
MKIKVVEKVKVGETKDLITYESNFVPSVGDLMGASSFPDLEQRIVVERLIIPTTEAVILYCNPPYSTTDNA